MTDFAKLRKLAERDKPHWLAYVDRFLSKVAIEGECLIWTGAVSGKPGRKYGCTWIGRPIKAHRFSFLVWNGELDQHLMVCHRCDRPLCVNPAHLYQGTASDNVGDAVTRGRHSNGERAKSACPRGHEYSDENTYVNRDGHRQCRACRRYHKGRALNRTPASLNSAPQGG